MGAEVHLCCTCLPVLFPSTDYLTHPTPNAWTHFWRASFALCGQSPFILHVSLSCISPEATQLLPLQSGSCPQSLITHTQIVIDLAQLSENGSCHSGFICTSAAHTVCRFDKAKTLHVIYSLTVSTIPLTAPTSTYVMQCFAGGLIDCMILACLGSANCTSAAPRMHLDQKA